MYIGKEFLGDSKMVGASGLEPLTPCVSSRYSNQLSYAPLKPFKCREPDLNRHEV
jgi:hypothetical protein